MDRFRKSVWTAVALLLAASLAVTPVMAKNRTITGRGIELPGEEPGLDSTGDPEPGGGGRPNAWIDPELSLRVIELLVKSNLELLVLELGVGTPRGGGARAMMRGHTR